MINIIEHYISFIVMASIVSVIYSYYATHKRSKIKKDVELVIVYKGKKRRYMIKNDIIVYLNIVTNAKYDKLYVNGKEVER